MKALILVGGYGTRLRPMTFSKPKPLVEFGNKPILCHQIEALKEAGCTEVILAVNYQPEVMMEAIAEFESTYDIKITVSLESEPLGTAGPIRLAESILRENSESGLFFVFNSDIICEYPLSQLIDFHRAHGRQGTIVVTRVEEPSRYGVVVSKEDGQIERFVEKPSVFVSNKINAGLYLFNMDLIDRIENRPTSIEREIFPQMAAEQQLYQMELPGYWMDIGQPADYIKGQAMYIQAQSEKQSNNLTQGAQGNPVIVHESATVDPTASLGPNVVIGARCTIGAGVRIRNSTILAGTVVKPYSLVTDSIIGWNNTVGSWVRTSKVTCTGEDVQIKDETCLTDVKVCPHKPVDGVHESKILM